MDSHKKSIMKAISWRVVATTDTFLIGWLVTGQWHLGASIAGIEVATKMFIYYAHERAWVKWGSKK